MKLYFHGRVVATSGSAAADKLSVPAGSLTLKKENEKGRRDHPLIRRAKRHFQEVHARLEGKDPSIGFYASALARHEDKDLQR